MSLAKRRVLCVDDDIDTLLMLAHLLLQEGFTAENFEGALGLSQEGSFDLYILDSWLPEESGASLCQKTESLILSPQSSSIPAPRTLMTG